MVRTPTVSKILSKRELYNIVISNIRDAGWNFEILSSMDKSPLKLSLTYGSQQEELMVYIWNISHGGKHRSKDEYRIQMKGKSLIIEEEFKTLLLGWFEEENIFSAFSAFKHKEFGSSPSVQVNIATLNKASKEGMGLQIKQTKTGQETVVTFQPSFIIEYIQDIYPQYHKNEISEISKDEIKILESHLSADIPTEELKNLSKERKNVLQTLNKKIRDRRFKKNIYNLYEGKCAICSLQARLTEAAHIVPVKDEGTDELVNGILLCRNHHRAFDTGLLGINEDYIIILNEKYVKYLSAKSEDSKLEDFLEESRIGEKIYLPVNVKLYPNKKYLRRSCKLKGI